MEYLLQLISDMYTSRVCPKRLGNYAYGILIASLSGARASTAADPSGNTAEYANMIAWQITNKLAAAIGCTLDCAIDAKGRMEISLKIPGPLTGTSLW